MKKRKKTTKKPAVLADSMSQAAGMLSVPVSKLRYAKRKGCRAFKAGGRVNLDELRAWLAAQPKPRAKRPLKEPALIEGAAQSLKRLEQAEAEAFRDLRAAQASGDLSAIEEARRWWLRCSEQLRKHDLAIELDRRASGELVPRSEVERILKAAGWFLCTAWGKGIDAAAGQLGGSDPHAVLATLTKVFDATRLVGLAGCKTWAFEGKTCPDWMHATLTAAVCQGHPAMIQNVGEIADLLQQFMAEAVNGGEAE